jgi:hypothetical protein
MKTRGIMVERVHHIGTFNIKNMSRKLIITISIVLGVILIGLVGYYFVIQNNNNTETGGKTTGFRSFFPFGGNNTTSNGTSTENNNVEPTPTPISQTDFTQKLRKLSSEPVSGAGASDTKAGTVVRYIEKATGHIFETELFSPKSNRISNTTIPLVYEAIWGNGNNSLIARYLADDNQKIDTYSLTLKKVSTTTENTVAAIAFSANINDVSVIDNNVFYLERGNGFSTGFVSKFDGTSKKQIWNSALQELLSQFVNPKTVALTTKPASKVSGFLYFIDTSTGSVKSILSKIPGLSTLVNDDATRVIYLEQGDDFNIKVLEIKTKISTETGIETFPEKCVWSKKDKTIIYR